MYRFNSDYTEGCHPSVLARLIATNMEQTDGYGADPHCSEARAKIKAFFSCPEADVHFLVGGTQTNMTVICAALRPHQAVFGAEPSHINTHEAGAIEHSGHKVIALPSADGKVSADQIAAAWQKYDTDPNREHWTQPKMVYISQPTELGSMYSKKELEDLYSICRKAGLYLFIDGARLGYALASPANDMSPADISANCDVFYIGGTKCGLLFGEAVVINNPLLKEDFRSIAKQNGALLAKGRLLGVQFAAAFTNDLYLSICREGTLQALRIRDALLEKNIEFAARSETNQQFVIFTRKQYSKLSESFALSIIEYLGNNDLCVRVCTSWATKAEETDKLIALIKEL